MTKTISKIYDIPYQSFCKCVKEVTGKNFNPHKSMADQGIDDLDGIEILLTIESELDIFIPDELWLDNEVMDFIAVQRDNKLKQLGI